MQFTKTPRKGDIERRWVVLDAKGKVFGRLVTEISNILRGKHKPCFSPNVDCGDFVIVVNAKEAKFSGVKLKDKKYFTHSGYFGSTKSKTLEDVLNNQTERLYRLAVRGMLPKNKLGRSIIKKLKVYKGDSHPHIAQTACSGKINTSCEASEN